MKADKQKSWKTLAFNSWEVLNEILSSWLYGGKKHEQGTWKRWGCTHTHTHTRHFLTEEKENACNRFDAGSCSYTQNLINNE